MRVTVNACTLNVVEHIDPAVALPVALLLGLAYFLPDFARWNRARRAARKATR